MWAAVLRQLRGLYPQHACREFLCCFPLFGFREDEVPQLEDLSAVLRGTTGWQIRPVAGGGCLAWAQENESACCSGEGWCTAGSLPWLRLALALLRMVASALHATCSSRCCALHLGRVTSRQAHTPVSQPACRAATPARLPERPGLQDLPLHSVRAPPLPPRLHA